MTTENQAPVVKQERQYKIGPVFCDICRKKVYLQRMLIVSLLPGNTNMAAKLVAEKLI
jgi:hypothetical protein